MHVIKRDGTTQTMQFDKITTRITKVMEESDITGIDPATVTQSVVQRIVTGISTSQIDELACQVIMGQLQQGQKYGKLASRLAISNCHKTTDTSFKTVINKLHRNVDPSGKSAPLISDDLVELLDIYDDKIEALIDYDRDYLIDYFGFATLKKAYLLKVNSQYVERPQHLFMRVALGMYGSDLDRVKKTYDGLSLQRYMHATPTLFHAGTQRAQMASCFLIGTEDSVEGIYGTITDCAKISKWAGGIGVHIHNIRSEGSYIRKTGGYSDGLMPMLRVYDSTARYINQSGKRNGSFAMYLEPWHADIMKFLHAKRAQGVEEERARDLFYALWIPDLFMSRVRDDETWSLMCPDQCTGLSDVYGDDFKELYEKYEKNGMFTIQVRARDIWENITIAQIESGVPYMLYKDACNRKSNQSNLGTIKSSNLCAEIVQHSDANNPSVCNLASISLKAMLKEPEVSWKHVLIVASDDCFYCKLLKTLLRRRGISFELISIEDAPILYELNRRDSASDPTKIIPDDYDTVPQVFASEGGCDTAFLGGFWKVWAYIRPQIDWDLLYETAYDLTYNLNQVIDKNFYPLVGALKTNFTHRPIGIGVQGLADMFAKMFLPFDSDLSMSLNKTIFETIYYGAMKASVDLAKIHGPYESFQGSPLSKGKFQFDLWGVNKSDLSGLWDWDSLREDVLQYGARNSLLVALMPTASTAQILGNNECFEPFTSNIYTRNTIAGEFTMVNTILFQLLEDVDMWNADMQTKLMFHRGSVQSITELPLVIRKIFQTVWEISQKRYIKMSADRGPFVCQSQSLNIWFAEPTFQKLYTAHMYSWDLGLKTGSYYVRQLPPGNAQRLGMRGIDERNLVDACESCSA